jgi:D-lactate dehydrogenase
VLINTGDLVRRLRAENQGALAQQGWKAAAGRWSLLSTVGGAALTVADALPSALPATVTSLGRALLGADTVPAYTADLPAGGRARRVRRADDAAAVFFPSCTATMFGPVGQDGVAESFLRLCERAGIAVSTPDDIPSLCCGTPWKSKGLTDGYDVMKERVAASLHLATRGGALPVVCDATSCTEGLMVLLDAAAETGIRVIDAVAFVDERILPKLPPGEKVESLTLHPTCSSTHLGINPALRRVADAAAESVVVPDDWGCCAFAGDRGMLHPELTASATSAEAAGAALAASVTHASVNRTCEIGMTRATGVPYEHLLQVLDATQRGVASEVTAAP